MTEQKCIVTSSLAALEQWADPAQIPLICNTNYSLNWKDTRKKSLFIIKPWGGFSITDSLSDSEKCDGSAEDIRLLREFAVNEKSLALEIEGGTGNSAYKTLLAFLDNPAFTGMIFCNMDVELFHREQLGPLSLTRFFSFGVPFLIIENVVFSENHADVSKSRIKGWMASELLGRECTDEGRTFVLTLQRIFASLDGEYMVSPGITLTLSLYSLFGMAAYAQNSLMLYGVYGRCGTAVGSLDTYHFLMIRGSLFRFGQGVLYEAEIEQAVLSSWQQDREFILDLSCEGRLKFQPISSEFDPFGYGDRADEKSGFGREGYLGFQHLHLMIAIGEKTGSMTEGFRNIRLRENKELLGENAVLAQLPYKRLSFVSHQDGTWPEALGFRRIQAPIPQETWNKEKAVPWFGIVAELEYFHGLSLELMFTFSGQEPFFAGARIHLGTGHDGGKLALSSLIGLNISDVLLMKDEHGSIQLMLRGVKVSLLGIQVPEGSMNIALLPDGEQESSWFCVYEK